MGASSSNPSKAGCTHRNVVVSVDGAPVTSQALQWALGNYKYGDVLHLVSVSCPQAGPYPMEIPENDFGAPSRAAIEEWRKSSHEAELETAKILHAHRQEALRRGVPAGSVRAVELQPLGGASGVGESIVRYAHENGAGMVVLGSRNLGGMKSLIMQMIGLGSVSEYTLRHCQVPVVIVKNGADSSHEVPTDTTIRSKDQNSKGA
eukprot:gene14542-20582_t